MRYIILILLIFKVGFNLLSATNCLNKFEKIEGNNLIFTCKDDYSSNKRLTKKDIISISLMSRDSSFLISRLNLRFKAIGYLDYLLDSKIYFISNESNETFYFTVSNGSIISHELIASEEKWYGNLSSCINQFGFIVSVGGFMGDFSIREGVSANLVKKTDQRSEFKKYYKQITRDSIYIYHFFLDVHSRYYPKSLKSLVGSRKAVGIPLYLIGSKDNFKYLTNSNYLNSDLLWIQRNKFGELILVLFDKKENMVNAFIVNRKGSKIKSFKLNEYTDKFRCTKRKAIFFFNKEKIKYRLE